MRSWLRRCQSRYLNNRALDVVEPILRWAGVG